MHFAPESVLWAWGAFSSSQWNNICGAKAIRIPAVKSLSKKRYPSFKAWILGPLYRRLRLARLNLWINHDKPYTCQSGEKLPGFDHVDVGATASMTLEESEAPRNVMGEAPGRFEIAVGIDIFWQCWWFPWRLKISFEYVDRFLSGNHRAIQAMNLHASCGMCRPFGRIMYPWGQLS